VTSVLLPLFIVFNICVAVIFIVNFYKYTKYNPDENNDPYFFFKVLLIFFLKAIKHWGIGLWIWLFGVSAYIFCFYKFQSQSTNYMSLPENSPYYSQFLIIFYIEFAFVLFSVALLIYDLGPITDYFMIDWEK
jgi:hypothetical protein